MDDLLRQWEGQSKKLLDLEVDIYRVDKDLNWEDEAHFTGHAAFKSPDLAYVDYRQVKMVAQPDPNVKNKKIYVPLKNKNGHLDTAAFQTILCTGKEVWDYRFDVQQVVIFTLNNDARKKVLDEGPLPFLFRMRVGDAKQRYNMVLRDQNAKYSTVMITPRIKEDQDVFSTAWIQLDRQFLLPTRILLVSPDKAKLQDFRLSNVRANKGVDGKYFVGVKPTKPWQVHINPGADQAGAPAAKRARRPGDAAAGRPAADKGQIQR